MPHGGLGIANLGGALALALRGSGSRVATAACCLRMASLVSPRLFELNSVFMALDRDIVRKMKALRSFLFVGLSRGIDVLVRWSMGARPTSEKSDDDNV